MTKSFKLESPKISADLQLGDFQAIYQDEDPYLSNCMIANALIDNVEIDKAVLSTIIF